MSMVVVVIIIIVLRRPGPNRHHTVSRCLPDKGDNTSCQRTVATPGSILLFSGVCQLCLEPLAPILFSRVWILLKYVPTAGLCESRWVSRVSKLVLAVAATGIRTRDLHHRSPYFSWNRALNRLR